MMVSMHTKVKPELRNEFNKKSKSYGYKPSEVTRMLMEAFVENRVKLKMSEKQLELFEGES